MFVTFVGLYTIKPAFCFTVVTFVPVMLYSLQIVMLQVEAGNYVMPQCKRIKHKHKDIYMLSLIWT